jgi:hypothetical protein
MVAARKITKLKGVRGWLAGNASTGTMYVGWTKAEVLKRERERRRAK